MAPSTQKTLWPTLSSALVTRMLSAHAGIGMIMGALLYIVSLSGVMVVFHAEFARWEQPDAPEWGQISPEQAAQAAQTVYDHALENGDTPGTIMVYMPTEASPRLVAGYDTQYWFMDEHGQQRDLVHHGFSEFLIDLHYYLHLPSSIGLIVVGMMGVMMLGLVISGFLSHPRILKDAFRTGKVGNAQQSLSDRHNRLSVWGAPFYIVMPLTGAALGLAGIVATILAVTQPEETAASLFDDIFGAQATAPAEAGPLPDVAAAIRSVNEQYADAALYPWIIQLFAPGQDGQALQMIVDAPERLIFGEYIQFDSTGAIIGKTGLDDGAFGQQAAASIYNLHFGNWGGIPIKIVYTVLGLALCVVCASGVQLWLFKRARKRGPQPLMERSWTAIVWSPPLLVGLCLVLNRMIGLPETAMPSLFWGGLAVLTVISFFIPSQTLLSRALRAVGGVAIIIGALAHFADYGLSGYQNPAAWGVMAAMVISGLVLSLSAALPFKITSRTQIATA